jgi:MFS family permease
MIDTNAVDRRARLAVAVVFLANGFIIGVWAAHIPLVEERLAISHGALGIALLGMAVGALIAMPLGGAAIARLGSATVLRVTTVTWFLSFPLPVLAPSFPLLVAGLFLFGAANGVMDVAMNAHGVLVERRLGRPVMSSYHGMFSLGGLFGAGLAALLLPVMPPSLNAIAMSALVALTTIAAFFHLLPSESDRSAGGPAFALPSKATVGIGALCFLALLSEGAILDWSALHLQSSLSLGAGLAATGFAAYSAAMAGGRFLGDWLRAHIGAVLLVRASAFLATFGLLIAVAVPDPLVAIIGFALSGLGLANTVPIFFGAGGKIPGQDAGTGIAAITTMGYAGFVAGPPLIGFAAQATSLALALGLVVLACALIGVFANAVRPADIKA